MKNKKGIEIQFNWIFVVIAGVFIIAFFYMIISGIIKNSESTRALLASDDINLILSGGVVTLGKEANVSLGDISIRFSCSSDKNEFSIFNEYYDTRDTIIFSPLIIENSKLSYKTLAINLPYRVSNIMLISGLNTKYYFVYEDDLLLQEIREIRDGMADAIDVEYVKREDIEALKYEENPTIKFIFYKTNPIFPESLKGELDDEFISAIKIDSISPIKITFYEYKENAGFISGEDFTLPVEEMLLGAIYSGDKESFECAINRIFIKYLIVSTVLDKKLELLSGDNPSCSHFYANSSIKSRVSLIVGQTGTYDQDGLSTFIDDLTRINQNAQVASCPPLY